MRYDTRALAFSTPTSPVIGLANLPAGKARLLQTVTSSDVGREAMRRFAATIPAAGNDSRALCEFYVQQLSDVARSRGATLSSEDRASLLTACGQDPARFKADAQREVGVALRDAPGAGTPPREGGAGGGGEQPNTWLWIAGGAAALGALLLLRR